MQLGFVKPGQTVICGAQVGRFLRMSGSDALIELRNGSRVMWSGATEVGTLSEEQEITEDSIPRLERELARLLRFTEGAYAQLGIKVDTPCTILPKSLHPAFVKAALGLRPADAIVCRRCPTKFCIRADHLFWGTRSDCQRDMVLRGVAKPSGKAVSAIEVVTKILKIQNRLTRLRQKCSSLEPVSDI